MRYDLPREIKADAITANTTSFMILVTEKKNLRVDLVSRPLVRVRLQSYTSLLDGWASARRNTEGSVWHRERFIRYPGCQRFFLVTGDRIERRSRVAKRREKNLWHQRITTSLPCRRQFPLIDIHSQSLF